MTAAGIKKARWQGGQKAWGNGTYTLSIDKKPENVKLPDWILKRLAVIAARQKDFAEYEHSALVVLAAECKAYPETASRLPARFLTAIAHCKPGILDPIERAAVLLVTADCEPLADLFINYPYKEAFRLKTDALASILKEGGAE